MTKNILIFFLLFYTSCGIHDGRPYYQLGYNKTVNVGSKHNEILLVQMTKEPLLIESDSDLINTDMKDDFKFYKKKGFQHVKLSIKVVALLKNRKYMHLEDEKEFVNNRQLNEFSCSYFMYKDCYFPIKKKKQFNWLRSLYNQGDLLFVFNAYVSADNMAFGKLYTENLYGYKKGRLQNLYILSPSRSVIK